MMQDHKQAYINYLASHNLLSFATADEKGNPFVRSVEYVNDGPNVYFLTDAKSAKVKHIKNNSNVAYTVDEDLADWSKIQGVQMQGKAFVIGDRKEKERAIEMLMFKFLQFAQVSFEGIEPCVIKIEPTAGIFIDNPSGAGTRYEIHYD